MDQDPAEPLARRHLRFGWWSLFAFACLGAALESLHGFKVDWYLAVGEETRRLLWRLAHAHGAFLGLVHVAFAVSLPHLRGPVPTVASPCLCGASIAIPGGFFLGGVGVFGGDPGVGILLLPLGVVLLLVAVVVVARAAGRR
jgi:hypothetical protein